MGREKPNHPCYDQRGLSLMEVVVGLGVMGIVVMVMSRGIDNFMRRGNQSRAIVAAEQELGILTKMYKRRVLSIDSSDSNIACRTGNRCKQIRIPSLNDGNNQRYSFTFETICQKMPDHLRRELKTVNLSAINSCLGKVVRCRRGSLPAVRVRSSSNEIRPSREIYPVPASAAKTYHYPFATAVCFNPKNRGGRLVLRADFYEFYLKDRKGQKNGNNNVGVVTKSVTSPIGNVAGIQFLD